MEDVPKNVNRTFSLTIFKLSHYDENVIIIYLLIMIMSETLLFFKLTSRFSIDYRLYDPTLSKISTMSFTFSVNNVFDNIVIACKCH